MQPEHLPGNRDRSAAHTPAEVILAIVAGFAAGFALAFLWRLTP